MAAQKRDAPAGYSPLQLEAGLSKTSLTSSKSSSENSSPDQLVLEARQVTLQPGQQAPGQAPMGAPQNFALVVPGVYRSSYPQLHDLTYLKSLKLKTIVTLVDKEIPDGYRAFLDDNGIKHIVFGMAGTKKADIPLPMMRSIIGLVTDPQNHPMLIHCNQGKHRTGCVVGVLRRYNGWNTQMILDEYTSFAEPKVRPTDVHYLREFQLTQLANIRQVGLRGGGEDCSESTLSMNHFVILYALVIGVIIFWILTTYGVVSLPIFEPPRRPRVSEI
ncbi:hypothetical protein KJ359_000830 [Pestalotiopsis sp. 9143b]|nr:hypothetical protein KJ359_000830 [Pestalotiopsis sp. 9143b]